MELDNKTYRLTGGTQFSSLMLTLGLLGLAASVAGYFVDSDQFFHSWLVASVYWVSIALGGLFFVLLHHLVAAKWSVVLRRLTENMLTILPLHAVCFLVVLLGIDRLYHWSDPNVVASDHLLTGKSGYLNPTFFVIRTVVYFVIWAVLSRLLFSASLRQDSTDGSNATKRMRIISAPSMVLFAITITFAAFDWMMSLDAHWYSTIYGVYFFAGSFLAFISVLSLVVVILKSRGIPEK